MVENTLMFDKNAYVFHVKKVVKLNKNGAFFTVLRHEEPMGAPKSKKKNGRQIKVKQASSET